MLVQTIYGDYNK